MAKRIRTAHKAPSGYVAGVAARFGSSFSLLNTSDTLVRAGKKGTGMVGGKLLAKVQRAASQMVRTYQVASFFGQFVGPAKGKETARRRTSGRTRKEAGA